MAFRPKQPATEIALEGNMPTSSDLAQPPNSASLESSSLAMRHVKPLALGCLIVAAAFIVYWPSLHGMFFLDDGRYLTENPLITGSDGLYRFWFTTEAVDYYPVSNTNLWIEWRLWGTNTTGYRVTNLVLHILTCLLLWRILLKLSIPGAFLAALLFAVHPLNVESVAWISQRKDMLALFLAMVSILFYLSYLRDEDANRGAAAARRNCV